MKSSTSLHPDHDDDNSSSSFALLTLEEIREKVSSLCHRVPIIPTNNFYLSSKEGKNSTTTTMKKNEDDDDKKPTSSTINADNNNNNINNNPLDVVVDQVSTREWAAQLQAVLEEYNLLVCCVATATYKWGTDRSGAADQNLNLLNAELASSQDSISSTVTPRLTNVLAPVVDLVIDKTVTTTTTAHGTSSSNDKNDNNKNDNKDDEGQQQHHEEIKQNYFTRKLGTSRLLLLLLCFMCVALSFSVILLRA